MGTRVIRGCSVTDRQAKRSGVWSFRYEHRGGEETDKNIFNYYTIYSMANDQETLEYLEWRTNPFKFIKWMWWLIPTNKDDKFVKGVHLTWQQTLIVKAVMDAVNDVKPRKITVASWHGIGKTAVFSMLLLRYLFCYIDAQVACTAPTQSQMYDVLWKEIAVWINRMPERAQEMYELSADFVKMVERPKTWWARARTARKESPEAIAGIHWEYVMIMVDEASAVPDEVYITAKGALTNRNMLMLMISNPTRLGGYFYKSHTSLSEDFQTFSFSSIDSPIVDYGFVNDIKKEYWEDSDEYRVRVLWQFPNEDAIDSKGYMRLFRADDIKYLTKVDEDAAFWHDAVLGVDPAWEGCFDDKTEILTDEWYKLFQDLTWKEKVLSLNPETDIASWENIDKIHKYEHNWYLNVMEWKRWVNFAITDNHKLLVKTRKWDWKLERYDNLPQEFSLKRVSGWKWEQAPTHIEFLWKEQPNWGIYKKRNIPFHIWAEFLWWFVSEGNVYIDKKGRYEICIAQNNWTNKDNIKKLLKIMGVWCSERDNYVKFDNQDMWKHLLEHCGKYAANKRIPKYIKEANPAIIETFLASFILWDWRTRKSGWFGMVSSSKLLIDDLQECLVKIGRAGKVSLSQEEWSETEIKWRKMIRKHNTYTLWMNKTSSDWFIVKSKVKQVPYNGFVYCVTTEKYHTISVRRNWVTMWSGNSDETVWVLRDNIKAKILKRETISTPKGIAQITSTLMTQYDIPWYRVIIDNFGVWTDCIQELALMWIRVFGLFLGKEANDKKTFLNKRAELYRRTREWLKKWGMFVRQDGFDEVLNIFYRRKEGSNQIQIMPKLEMKRDYGIKSPNIADSLAFTFLIPWWGMEWGVMSPDFGIDPRKSPVITNNYNV